MAEYAMKQVLILRHDLGMRRGKSVTQGAHASMLTLLPVLFGERSLSKKEKAWLEDGMSKITVRVDSLDELMALKDLADEAAIQAHMITDRGYTEFKGEPTITALAIGPDAVERIDAITGHLKLL